MADRNNLAYDLSRFEERAPEKKPKIRLTQKRGMVNAGSAPKAIATIAVIGLAISTIVISKVENAQLYSEIRQQNQSIAQLQDENNRMKSEIDGRSSLKNVENYAENVLGLEKLNKSQIEYIKVEADSVVEIPEVKEDFFTSLKNKAVEVWEYLNG